METKLPMEAIILAGGLGTRLRMVVRDVPKPMAPVCGRPFLAYQLDYLQHQGIERVVLALAYQWEIIRDHFGDIYNGLNLAYSVEQEPLGTGGGLLLAFKKLNMGGCWCVSNPGTNSSTNNESNQNPLLVLNGDTWFPVPLAKLLSFHNAKRSAVTVGVSQQQDSQRYAAIALSPQGKINSFYVEVKNEHNHKIYINGGVYLFSHHLLTEWQNKTSEKLSLEHNMFEKIVAENNCYGFVSAAPFLDIGVPEAYYKAQQMFSEARPADNRHL
ncbi:MAG: NTP transferase domain-containing protein [Gammaproteobacteria bacterium]|nr:NTP transferase domain-containing protein [Gammaproteobacteria bacterium]